MTRPTLAYIQQITAGANQWLRRCNGLPPQGIPISRRSLRIALANSSSKDLDVDAHGVISWSAEAGEFTAEPVRDSATP